jgi:hypothetical protein
MSTSRDLFQYLLTRMETIVNVIFNMTSNNGAKLLLSRYLF